MSERDDLFGEFFEIIKTRSPEAFQVMHVSTLQALVDAALIRPGAAPTTGAPAPTGMQPGQRCTFAASHTGVGGAHAFNPKYEAAWSRNRFLAGWREPRCEYIEPPAPVGEARTCGVLGCQSRRLTASGICADHAMRPAGTTREGR